MKNVIKFLSVVLVAVSLIMVGCSDDSSMSPSGDRRGGNGNGNGNGNGGGGGTTPYTVVNTAPTNWGVTYDTTSCGRFHLMWNAQPGAVEYFVNVIERPWNCAGSAVTAPEWWYTYGYGCSMVIGSTYHIQLSYFIKDDINRVTTYYYSDTVEVRTGSYGLWNCP